MGISPAQNLAPERDGYDRPVFLSSHRAIAACTREFGRFTDGIAQGVGELRAAAMAEAPEIRMSPGRCIVQFGPVALTVAWLRSTLDSVADGQLLVIVWRGSVAPRASRAPERGAQKPGTRVPLAATALWEDSFTASAANEASWTWRPQSVDVGGLSSSELATRCVDRLRAAYAKYRETR
jgi:hypothetical protein